MSTPFQQARRTWLRWLSALPFGLLGQTTGQSAHPGAWRVAAGTDRFKSVKKLPGGDLLYVKVATVDTGGALFMTEQPISRRGVGPPKHYHEDVDEWFYCLAGLASMWWRSVTSGFGWLRAIPFSDRAVFRTHSYTTALELVGC